MDAVPPPRGRAHHLRPHAPWPSATATTCASSARPIPRARGGVLSFAYRGIHPHDLSQVLDETGVCIRAGHHCAKPLMRRMGVNATARASFYVYNDESDVDALSEAPPVRRQVLRLVRRGHRWRSKTSTARSSSTTTATRGTGATCPARPPCGSRASTRCAATRSSLYVDIGPDGGGPGGRHPHLGPGLLDQPVVGVDDVGRGQGPHRGRGPGPDPGLQGHDVDPRAPARRRRPRGRRRRWRPTPR